MKMDELRIISSAIKVNKDNKEFIIMGKRHWICYQTMLDAGIKRPFKDSQGFMTSEFEFVDRREAKAIAVAANQILSGEGKYAELFSEDIFLSKTPGEDD